MSKNRQNNAVTPPPPITGQNKLVFQKRNLEIKDFRNIGISKATDDFEFEPEPTNLTLNIEFTNDVSGGLVIVIGENNTGKSNVASALSHLQTINEEFFSYRDTPNFPDYESCFPRLTLTIKKEGKEEILASMEETEDSKRYRACNENELAVQLLKIYINDLYKESVITFSEVQKYLARLHTKSTKTFITVFTELRNKQLE